MTRQPSNAPSKETLLSGYASLPRALSYYSLSIALIAAAFFLHEFLERLLGDEAAYLLFAVPAVIIAGGLGGLGPGLLTTALGIVVAIYFSGESYHLTLDQIVSVSAFVALGVGMAWLGDRLQRARFAAAASTQNLLAREAHLSSILETMPDAMIVIDEQGLMHSFSSAAEQLFGYTQQEALCQNVNMLMPSPYRENHDSYIRHYLQTGERRIIGKGRVVVGKCKDGSTFPMELFIGEMKPNEKRFFTGFIRDLTERQKTEARLRELQSELVHISRLTAMGEMASTLAHEVNQPLAVIANYLNGARRLLADNSDEQSAIIREALNKAAGQALQVGQIIRRLREFVSRGEAEQRAENIGKLIEEASALALVGIKEQDVQVRFQLDDSVDLVLADKVQIQQVLLNLMRNAIEAMENSAKRKLTVSSALLDNNMVAIRVADTGSGIAPDVASQLFQPFFTTKRHGMGIGLSICRSIVEAHGGKITVQPHPEGGTIFCFTLHPITTENFDDHK